MRMLSKVILAVAAVSLPAITASAQGPSRRLVSIRNEVLRPVAPANVGGRDSLTKSADAIIGYYDKGHNYHAEHMGASVFRPDAINPIKVLGRDLIVPRKF